MNIDRTGSTSPVVPEPQTLAELTDSSLPTDWLWHGYLARGSVTLLTSQWKTGKTTLFSVLMSRMATGGELAGRAVQAARPAIISEESPALWRLRGERLEFGSRALFFCRPFPGKPTIDEWQALLDRLLALRGECGLDAAVLDPLASLLPIGVENHGDKMFAALRPLERLTQAGLAVLVLHHPRKGSWRPGQAARGSGVLSSYADILIEMSCPPSGESDDRRRLLSSWSRFDETPRELTIELSADGCDYTACAPFAKRDDELEHGLAVVQEVLARTGRQMKREHIVEEWPEKRAPHAATVWRWLERGVARGHITRYGLGKSGDPYRYAIAGVKAKWEPSEEEILEGIAPRFRPRRR